jgi:thiosulfate dehydrogenase
LEAKNFMKHLALGLIVGLLALPLALGIYLLRTGIPVAVGDKPFAWEGRVVGTLLHLRIAREMPKKAPIEADSYNLEAGMQIYRSQCASCHGLYEHPSSFGQNMYPSAPQLWELHGNGAVGVSDDPVGEIYWKAANGVRLTGMPAYKSVLNDTQMWQVSLLLANANKPLPIAVLELLKKPLLNEPLPAAPSSTSADFPGLPELPKLPAPLPPVK